MLTAALYSTSINVAYLKYFLLTKYFIMFILISMEGLTVEELANLLSLEEGTVRVRLSRAGIKPITHSPVYPFSALEAIRGVRGKGRPPKDKPAQPAK
jgi:hypothetical protein